MPFDDTTVQRHDTGTDLCHYVLIFLEVWKDATLLHIRVVRETLDVETSDPKGCDPIVFYRKDRHIRHVPHTVVIYEHCFHANTDVPRRENVRFVLKAQQGR